jgi:hypothetical protein
VRVLNQAFSFDHVRSSEFTQILRGPNSRFDVTRSNAQTAATSPFLLDVSTTIAISDSHASAPRLISILWQCIRRWGRRMQRISVPQL